MEQPEVSGTATGPAGRLDLLAIGEAMALVTPANGERLDTRAQLALRSGGAESNVAAMMAALGLRTAWLSALGADPLGDAVLSEIEGAGVDVSMVRRDPLRPTGVYFKSPDPDASRTRVYYYRAGSAASALGPESVEGVAGLAAIVHLSGVTVALSPSCAALVDHVVGQQRAGSMVSFDVNYRPALWQGETPADRLLDVAQRCDIVFVGLDEAHALWGTSSHADVRALVDKPAYLVVKDGANCAVSFDSSGTCSEPAPFVEIVEVVGAGDAFAAGWLAAHLSGAAASVKLRVGHWVAGQVLRSSGDLADVPDVASVLRTVADPSRHAGS